MGPRAAICVCLGLAGCGDALTRAALEDVRTQLAESQRRTAAAEKKLDALEDKLFLLTDQVESQKVESNRRGTPRLPVVTLRPSTPEPSGAPAADDDAAADCCDFSGAARSADPAHARPLLTNEGPVAPQAQAAPRAAHAAPTPRTPTFTAAAPSDSLGVAPAPPIRRAPPSTAASAPSSSGSPPVAAREAPDPLHLYRTAYENLRAGRYDEAERGFRELLKQFPRHDYADNAQYWLGECYYARKRFAEAAPEFRAVVTRYPLGNKAPDALLKLAYCLLALGDQQKARDLLAQLPETYPRTEAARLASERLGELGRVAPTGGTL